MGSNLNVVQKALRPIINWAVESFFPQGAFFGKDYMTPVSEDAELAEKWGSAEMACMMFVTHTIRNSGADVAAFTANDVTNAGVPQGSWLITVERIEDSQRDLDAERKVFERMVSRQSEAAQKYTAGKLTSS